MTCELVVRRDAGEAPLWDAIDRTPGWDVAHAFGTSVEGWLVLVARRHVAAVADLTEGEAAEIGPLVHRLSRILRDVVGCEKTYVVQLAEHPDHRHVHIHVIPRAHDLPAEHRGPRIFGLVGLPEPNCVSEARRDELASAIRARLTG